MLTDRIAVLTSRESWFVSYAKSFVTTLKERGLKAKLFQSHEEIGPSYKIVFVLSYFRITPKDFFKKRKHTLVVHESALPRGRGWSPFFWQILEGKNRIPIVLFEADEKVDQGRIYLKDYIRLQGNELHDELRRMQAEKTVGLCLKFLDTYENLQSSRQRGNPSYYARRLPQDSELDLNKSIREQFNLLRIVDNKEFPAFFYHKGCKYIIKIDKMKR